MMPRNWTISQTCLVFLLSLEIASCGGQAGALTSPSPSAGATAAPSTTHGSVFFVTNKVGWVVAVPPDRIKMAIYRTADGGAHWRLLGVSPAIGRPVGFTTTEVVVNTRDGLVRSSDGARWEVDPLPSNQSYTSYGEPFFLPDLQHGWLTAIASSWSGSASQLGPGCVALPPYKGGGVVCQTTFIWYTADGGGSWKLQAERHIDTVGAMTFWSSTSGAMLAGAEFAGRIPWGPSLELTNDGGVTWHESILALPRSADGASARPDRPVMLDDLNGMLALNVTSNGPPQVNETYVSRTSDGGRNWSTPQPVQAPGSVVFLDDHRWLAAGDGVFASTDAGHTWRSTSTMRPPAGYGGVQVIRSHPGTAFVLSPDEIGGLFASVTTDWGAHWHAVGLPETYQSYTGVAGMGGWPISI
jgi:photosystem II stability/assembly factor-like uncharacterized protein